jgi:hypothetical protein
VIVSNKFHKAALIKRELILVLAIVAVAAFFFLTQSRRARRSSRVGCIAFLHQIGVTFRLSANDNDGAFPMTKLPLTNSAAFYFRAAWDQMSSPKMLVCDTDLRKPSITFSNLQDENISYFLGLDASDQSPDSILSGDRNITLNPTPPGKIWELGTNKNVGWSKLLHQGRGNILLSDGSIQTVEEKKLRSILSKTGNPTNRIVMPL